MRSGRTAMRLAAIVLAAVCIAAATGRSAGGSTAPSAGTALGLRGLEFSGLELRAPTAWFAKRYGVYCHFYGPDLLLTNVATGNFARQHDPSGCSDGLNVRRAPRGFVALELSIFTGPTPPTAGPSAVIDSHYPPKLTGLTRIPENCRCVSRVGALWLDGKSYSLHVWIGNGANAASLARLNELLGSIKPSLIPGASMMSAKALKTFAGKLGHTIYWAGALPGLAYEIRNNPSGTYVRYLPPGVPAGSAYKYLTVATIPLSDAYNATKTEAEENGTGLSPGHGGIAFSGTEPSGSYIWIAFPGFQYQIVVSGTSADKVRKLVTSGAIGPVR